MSRLTERDRQGHWRLKKLNWDDIRPGEKITVEDWETMYLAMYKLLKYEDTGLYPDQIREIGELYLDKCREVNDLKEKAKSANAGWIPFEQRRTDNEEKMSTGSDYILTGKLPDDGQEILASDGEITWHDTFFDDGCEVYLDSGIDIIDDAKAWMPLPDPYKPARLECADNQAADHADQDTIAPAT